MSQIFVIDDDHFSRRLLERQLAVLKHDGVRSFARAEEALGVVASDPGAVGLVLCGLEMDEMDGVAVLRQLGRIGFVGGLGLITGGGERVARTAEELARAHGLQILGALHKPVPTSRLQQIVERARSMALPKQRRPSGPAYTAAEIARAIGCGEITCHFQPKVDMATARMVGVESLARWQHPRDGMVYPDRFISIAEEQGLIDDLTRAVLAAALQAARQWHRAGLAIHVAVNVSMDNLVRLDFADLVAAELERWGVAPGRLVLEVTESRLMTDRAAALETLTRLRLAHIGLAIDDFGTGHSSLSHLRDLPFTELKLDRSFVHGATRDPVQQAILEASLGVSARIGLLTVAEGVEDLEDWQAMQASHCDMAQGYFIARPMPAPALADWNRAWQARACELTPPAPSRSLG